jgi:thioredoxin-like negative regulator of GroEL
MVAPIMQTDASSQQIEHLKSNHAVLLLFGGPQCGVCQAIKPKLARLMEQRYPEIVMVYVDCAKSPDICAQHGVFSLPVVQLYIEGHLYLERGRSFGLIELDTEIERIFTMWKPTPDEL